MGVFTKLTKAALVALIAMAQVLTIMAQEYGFGEIQEYSTYEKGEMLHDSYNYIDDWFFMDPSVRNDELALMSMQLDGAAVEAGDASFGGRFLKDVGFTEVGYNRFGSEDPNDCTFTWGKKTITDGEETYTLLAIAIQSYALDNETKAKGWTQNFIVNGEEAIGEHYAYAKAVDCVMDEIVELASGKVKIWISGHSRGGALANLIAMRLNDCPLDCHGIYAYTFEAPALTDAADASAYSYIHNYLSGDDIVTRIPMWSLTRYGNVYDLKAEVDDESLHEELVKLGSSAADFTQSDVTEKVDQIISYLEERIGSRADYSLERNDTFADEQGNPLDISYCYQTALADVMGFVFSGALDDLSSQVLDRLDDLVEPAYQLYDAVNHENDGNIEAAMACYYAAATGFHEVLETFTEEPLSIGVEDIYALLKLIGPFGVNADYEFSGDSYDVISIISPLVTLAMNASSYTYSHTFDTVLARLKALAPQKALTDINIEVSVPQAEDALNKAVDEATADIADLGYAWLTCQAYWDTDDTSLQEGTVYYLHVTLTATGHVTNEDFALTLNGESPLDSYHISYANGATIVNAIWKFSIGESQQVQVCFDNNGHGKDIGILSVDRGTALRYEDLPEYDEYVSDDLGKWHFYGWQDQDGNSIENLIVTENTTVYAKWKQVVDEIAVHLDIPSAGHKMNDPYVDEDALYCIGEYNAYIDELYDEFEVVEAGLSYAINIFVKLKDEETAEFITEDFVDWKEYSGVFLVNGEETDDPFYDEYYGYVQATYIFHAMEEVIEEQADYSLKEGEGSHYELGSNTGLVFVVKRSVNDEETFDHFAGIKVDGTILDATMYEAERGSAVISLTNTYLNTLTTGSHTLEILFDDGSITTSFTITAKEPIVSKETPNTQDTSHIGLWHALLWIGILGSGSAAVILTKAAH